MKAIVDCNSFYASCERLFLPALRGKPVVVLSNNDGCIVSRTDEAKALGIRMAGPYFQNREAIERHGVAVFSSNYHLYGDMSRRVMETLRRLAPSVEVYSVDECFIDLEGLAETNLTEYSLFIKHTTEAWTGIPVSVGVAPTKVLSKVANRLAKKDKRGTGGVLVLETEAQREEALRRTAVEDIWGVGPAGAETLRLYNVQNAWELSGMSEEWASHHLGGVVGVRLVRELRGIPCIPMKDALTVKKNIATTRMFGKPVYELSELREAVSTYAARSAEKLRRQACAAGSLLVFLVRHDREGQQQYRPVSRSISVQLSSATALTPVLAGHAAELVTRLYVPGSRYIKAGVILSHIVPEDAVQLSLFDPAETPAERKLMQAIDNINASLNADIVRFAAAGIRKNWKMRQEKRSPRYTTRWDELCRVK